jgi:O-antigen/teichoic acid export membrane protein
MKLLNKANNPAGMSLKGKLSFLMKDTFFFGGLMALNQLFPFITIPILTSYLKIQEYGVYDNLLILSSLIATIVVFGQDSAVARWFYEVDSLEERKKIISESFLLQIICAFTFVIVGYFFNEKISIFFFNSAKYKDHISISLLTSFFLFLNNFSINILKWTFKRLQYSVVVILKAIFQLAVIVYALWNRLNLVEFLIINLFVQILVSIIGIAFCFSFFISPFSFNYLGKLLKFALPLGFLAVTTSMLPALDRKIIVNWLDSPNNLGLYALAMKIASLVKVGDGIFHMAWGPFSYAIFKDNDAQKTYGLVLNLYFLFFLFFILTVWIFTPQLVYVLGGKNYHASTNLIFPLLFGQFFTGLSGITGVGIDLSLKSYLNILPTFVSLTTIVVFGYFFVPYLGLYGVALSFMFSSIIRYILVSYISYATYKPIQLSFLKYLTIGLLIIFSFTLIEWFTDSLSLKVFSVIFCLVITLIFVLDHSIRETIQKKIKF